MRTQRFVALALLAGVILAPSAHAQRGKSAAPTKPLRTGLESIERQVQEFTLANGLKFLVVERHQAPVFSFFTVVNSGSSNDAVGTTGIAHMMEHMAFKGTTIVGTTDYAKEAPLLVAEERAWEALIDERRKGPRADAKKLAALEAAFADAQKAANATVVANEATQVIERAGGVGINAFTANDITAYFYSLPSNRIELWSAMHAATFIDPVFREFYKERDVVIEERRMRIESSPIGRLFYEFITTAFNAHPYGFGGIGHASDLRTFSRTEGEEFFRTNYVAKNMTVVLVGDVKLAEVKRLAEQYFAPLSDAPAPGPLDTVEPEQIGERRVTIEDKAQPAIMVGWHIPAASDPSYPAFKAAADILGGGAWSRLQKSLVKERKIATVAQAFTGFPGERYPNLFGLFMFPATGTEPQALEQAAYGVLDQAMSTEPITQAELDGYKVRVRAAKIAAVDDNASLAGELAQAQSLYGDWREFFRETERVLSLTPEQLTTALKGAVTKKNRIVAMMVPPPAQAPAAEGGR